jgi:hypothetical protein
VPHGHTTDPPFIVEKENKTATELPFPYLSAIRTVSEKLIHKDCVKH